MVRYQNRIDFRYRYAQNKASSAVVSLNTIHKYKNNPNNGILIVNRAGAEDRLEFFKKYQYHNYFDLTETRHILANIFVNHKDFLKEIMDEGYKYGSIGNLNGYILVTFLQERQYKL